MFGKRGEIPPLPRNCYGRIIDGRKPLRPAGRWPSSPESGDRFREQPHQTSEGEFMRTMLTAVFLLALSIPAWPDEPAITGTVSDSLGAVIPKATVALVQNGKDIATTTSDAVGKF